MDISKLSLNLDSTDEIKGSIQAATRFCKAFVSWIGQKNSSTNDEIAETWLMWLQTQSQICNLLETTNNDGIRTHCVKFIETIVLMQTPSEKHTDASFELNLIDPDITPVKLSDEAKLCGVAGLPKNGILFDQEHKLELVEAAKMRFEQLVLFHGTSHISSVNLMATMQSLVVLAKQRYRLFMGRTIQAMESLNNRMPPTLTESQVRSVKKFLKLQLTVMLKHPYSLDRYQVQLTQLLRQHKIVSETQPEAKKKIKLEPGGRIVQVSKHLDLNKLTQELDEEEKRQIVVDSVKRILGDENCDYISPAQMEIKKKVLSTLACEFNNTEVPKIIQDYIFHDLRNRHEICYAIIEKHLDVAAAKATKRQVNLSDNQEILQDFTDCYFSYKDRAANLSDSPEKDMILEKLYALKNEYYASISKQ